MPPAWQFFQSDVAHQRLIWSAPIPLIEVGENGLAPANHMEDVHVDTNIEMNQCLSDKSLNDVVGGLGGRLGAVFRFAVYSPGSLGTTVSAFTSAAHAVGSVMNHFKFW